MVNAKMYYRSLDGDTEMQRTAWQTSLLMSATGNYGKKGIEPKKLYKPQFDEMGRPIETTEGHGAFTPIDKEEKDKKLSELIAKFNNR
ncbi:hypothetical protein PDJ86_22190 [Bacillus cereus group sp. TH36-2LC]|nr:hypothetical protein [Bacillus cereus group sp. TH36-2LC]